jgi:hypothetical protein
VVRQRPDNEITTIIYSTQRISKGLDAEQCFVFGRFGEVVVDKLEGTRPGMGTLARRLQLCRQAVWRLRGRLFILGGRISKDS